MTNWQERSRKVREKGLSIPDELLVEMYDLPFSEWIEKVGEWTDAQ